MWKRFKCAVVGCAEKVRRLRGGVGKDSEWWCENLSVAVAEKRRAHGVWLKGKNYVSY